MNQLLTVPFDDEVLLITNMTPQEFIDRTKFTMAATLWMDGKITAGQAAKMCGLGKVAFLHELPRYGFPMSNLGPDDLDDELELARMERSRGK